MSIENIDVQSSPSGAENQPTLMHRFGFTDSHAVNQLQTESSSGMYPAFMHVHGLSSPGSTTTANQDRWGHSVDAIWVIDGATNLDKIAVSPGGDDGEWIASTLDRFLYDADWSSPKSTIEILKDASQQMGEQYAKWVEEAPIKPATFPSATLTIVRRLVNSLEYVVLGDCSLTVLDSAALTETYVTTYALSALDNAALGEMVGLREQGMSFAEARSGIQDTLVRHRSKMNRPDGYWVFSLDPDALDNAAHGTIEVSGCLDLILASDGFSRLWDMFGIVKQGQDAWKLLDGGGLENALALLRQKEFADAEILAYPRFKVSDDASCAFGHVCKRIGN